MAQAKSSKKTVDYGKIKKLISLMEQNGLTELAVEEDGISISIKAEMDGDIIAVSMPVTSTALSVQAQAPPAPEPVPEHIVNIEAPMIGVFYRCPKPDLPPFIEVGDEIEVGQTLGLIEAMKVFSEVPSEVAGRVVSVPAETGKLVQAGDILVVVDTSPIG